MNYNFQELFLYLFVLMVYWGWCWYDGKGDAFTFAVCRGCETERRTKHWVHVTAHSLLFRRRIPVYVLVLFLSVLLFQEPLWLFAGMVAFGSAIHNGSMRREQSQSLFGKGHVWPYRMSFQCPDWLIWRWPVVSCRVSKVEGKYIWVFRKMNGKLKFGMTGLFWVFSIYEGLL